MEQDFIPPLVFSKAPLDGDMRVGRATSFHIRCMDLGNEGAELSPATLSIDVHYRPEDPDMANAPWPPVRVYENSSFVPNTGWDQSSSVDQNDALTPTEIDIFLRRDELASYGERLRVVVTIEDTSQNRTRRELSYGFVESNIYTGTDAAERDPLEEELLRPFGIPEIDLFVEDLYTSLVDSTGLDDEVVSYLATRRAFNILKILNMQAALFGLFTVPETLLDSKVYNAVPMSKVLESSTKLEARFRKLRNFLLLRQDLCDFGYLEFADNCVLQTKPQTVLGAYISLWLALVGTRMVRENVSAG